MQTPSTVIAANIGFILFWLAAVLIVFVVARRSARVHTFREEMVAQWKPALAIALLFLFGMALGGRSILNPYALAIFCQAMFGFALARRIANFEPLPVTRAAMERKSRWGLQFVWMTAIALAAVLPALLVGSIGMSVAQQIFHETNFTREAASSFPGNALAAFGLLLAGAGIAEETTYRLVIVSFVWYITRHSWFGIFAGALLFGAYHLSPLDGMYQIFWQFPISQFLASTLIGIVWGYIYVKRGFETVVLAHTFSDWIPYLIFVR
ncbi:MAG: CPBP family intramembrane metalloprotease [Chloroflexi bacterium]|nr:CPBP family intramembrane metalloprotease [Chloroflexota bacterium]